MLRPPKPANAVFGKPPSQLRFNPLISPHRLSWVRLRRSATLDQLPIKPSGGAHCDGRISTDHENVAGKPREWLPHPLRSDLGAGRDGQRPTVKFGYATMRLSSASASSI